VVQVVRFCQDIRFRAAWRSKQADIDNSWREALVECNKDKIEWALKRHCVHLTKRRFRLGVRIDDDDGSDDESDY
jgi:hypothetical protein